MREDVAGPCGSALSEGLGPSAPLVERLRGMDSPRRTQALRDLGAEAAATIEHLTALATCACGDGFTEHDPGTCGACMAGQDKTFEVERLRAEIQGLTALREADRVARENEVQAGLDEIDKLRNVIRRSANIMAGGEGVQDQGEAWDRTQRLLNAAVAEFGA